MIKAKILLADDDSSALRLLGDFLDEEGFDVTTAADGRFAIDALKRETFSLVITDLNMPRTSGSEVLTFVKKHTPQVPVIIMSANASDEAQEQAGTMGASDFVIKPIQLDDLIDRIVRLVPHGEHA